MGVLEGKVAMVTGGAHGIGRATVRALAREGARVVIADIALEAAEAVALEVRRQGAEARAVHCDVSQEPDVEAAVAATVGAFGGLDILHNNAAYLRGEGDYDIANLSVETWERTFRVNALGVMLGCKYGVRAMLERGAGSIVNTSSGSAAAGDLLLAAYGASKGAVNSFTRYVAAQYGKQRIRCNAIAPGLIKSDGVVAGMGPERIAEIEEHCLVPRTGEPEDIAEMVVYLASDAASFVTAQVIAVDGGIASHVPTFADKNRAGRGNAH
jgi:NAD(P)-dependent dehydrogenase (short-subunit alcohol dehydrogenase family)